MFYSGADGINIPLICIFILFDYFSFKLGIILVHDLTNYKSQENLKQWLFDIIEQNENINMCSSDL
jgi:hypothetical protein